MTSTGTHKNVVNPIARTTNANATRSTNRNGPATMACCLPRAARPAPAALKLAAGARLAIAIGLAGDRHPRKHVDEHDEAGDPHEQRAERSDRTRADDHQDHSCQSDRHRQDDADAEQRTTTPAIAAFACMAGSR
jgi:hypothetical protein